LPTRSMSIVMAALAVGLSAALSIDATAQTAQGFGRCVPMRVRAHAHDAGCFIAGETPVGRLGPLPSFWHVTRFGSRRVAESAARTAQGAMVVDAFDATWLLAIGPERWRASAGLHVAAIGPLPLRDGVDYAALYMVARMEPGTKSSVHRHSGPEAWFTLSGQTCVETPAGATVGRSDGDPVIVPGGVPMELTATGTTTHRSLVLILHDATRPPTTMAHEWTPSGACAPPAGGEAR